MTDRWVTFQELPKVEIHRHLEGSLRLSTLAEIARSDNLLHPNDEDSLREQVQIPGEKPVSATEFLAKFRTIRDFFRSSEIIQRLVDEAVEDAALDHVRALELRFTPAALAQAGGFALEDVTDWVLSAAETAGARHNVKVAIVLSINRHEPVELAARVASLAAERQPLGVTGLDLAGDEAGFPAEPFSEILGEAKDAGLGLTVHAGEWAGADNVRFAIEELQADRIGHGIRVLEDADTTDIAAQRSVIFEVSLTSNWKTGAVSDLKSHPLPQMVQAGLAVTLATDDPSIFETKLSSEYDLAQKHFGFSLDSIKAFNLIALRAMFIPEREKRDIERDLIQAYWGMEAQLASDR